MGRGRRLLVVVALALAALATAYVVRQSEPSTPAASAGVAVLPVRLFTGPPQRWETWQPGPPTVVVVMAPWCRYCAWEDHWVAPALSVDLARDGVRLLVVDGSKKLGVATAGPLSAPGGGADGRGPAIPVTSPRYVPALLRTLAAYRARYHVQVWANPAAGLKARWRVTEYPTFLFVNAQGVVVARIVGVAPLTALAAELARLGWAPAGGS
jgi:thiol-disulfide isomerase/thioredoxin